MKKLESLNNSLFENFKESQIQKQLLVNARGGETTSAGCVNYDNKHILEFSSDTSSSSGMTYNECVSKGDIDGSGIIARPREVIAISK